MSDIGQLGTIILSKVEFFHLDQEEVTYALATDREGSVYFLVNVSEDNMPTLRQFMRKHRAIEIHEYFASRADFVDFSKTHEVLQKYKMEWTFVNSKIDAKASTPV